MYTLVGSIIFGLMVWYIIMNILMPRASNIKSFVLILRPKIEAIVLFARDQFIFLEHIVKGIDYYLTSHLSF